MISLHAEGQHACELHARPNAASKGQAGRPRQLAQRERQVSVTVSRENSQRRLRSHERLTVDAEDIPRKAELGNEGGEQVLRRRERTLLCELRDGLLLGGGHGSRRSGRLEAWMQLQLEKTQKSSDDD